MPSIHANFLGSIDASVIYDDNKKVISKGRMCNRIELALDNNGLSISVATVGKKIFKNLPKQTLIEKLFGFFGRKYVILKIHTEKDEGFIKVNAESFRKRLGLTKAKFQEIIKKFPNREVTVSAKEIISNLEISFAQELNRIKEAILDGFKTHTEVNQLHSAKILFRFMAGLRRFEPSLQSLKRDFTISPFENNSFNDQFLLRELDKIFAEMTATKAITTPNTKVYYLTIFKRQDQTMGEFSRDGFISNMQPLGVNKLYGQFAGKSILDDQFEFI